MCSNYMSANAQSVIERSMRCIVLEVVAHVLVLSDTLSL